MQEPEGVENRVQLVDLLYGESAGGVDRSASCGVVAQESESDAFLRVMRERGLESSGAARRVLAVLRDRERAEDRRRSGLRQEDVAELLCDRNEPEPSLREMAAETFHEVHSITRGRDLVNSRDMAFLREVVEFYRSGIEADACMELIAGMGMFAPPVPPHVDEIDWNGGPLLHFGYRQPAKHLPLDDELLTDEEIADLKNRLTDRDGVIGLSD